MLDPYVNKENVIGALQNIQIRRFRNGLNGSTVRSTHVEFNVELPQAERLRQWFHSDQAKNCSWISLSDTTGVIDVGRNTDFSVGGYASAVSVIYFLYNTFLYV